MSTMIFDVRTSRPKSRVLLNRKPRRLIPINNGQSRHSITGVETILPICVGVRGDFGADSNGAERLTAMLSSELGTQRAGILMEQGKRWFAESVFTFAGEPKVISVGWINGYLTIKLLRIP